MSGKNWILLVAGSKEWENYKHQANVCCLYQLIKKHGIPDEQIVVMMYDDIAYHKNNPCNGIIISVVDDDSNVYSGVPKDYTGEDVTPENFLAALQGKSTGRKVIKSGPNDNIYVYMCGLGKEGAFQFLEKELHPDKLIETLKNMHEEKTFSKMVIYMDSSYSATMFEELPKDINVFALTSCNKYVEPTPTDYDEQRKVFLSDKFSSTWLKYLNTAKFQKDTFHDLVQDKQSAHKGPCPCQFGDRDITNCYLRDFLKN